MDILNNSWVVGIGGGILSGLIVTLITRYFFSKKDNKEYAQKISSVNREVVYALRPGISEGHIPDAEVLDSLINATARKYRVERKDAYRAQQIAEELIKEIMDSSFISSETKKSYCNTLAHLVALRSSDKQVSLESIERNAIESDYRQKQSERMSLVLGMTTTILTIVAMVTSVMDKPVLSVTFKSLFDIALPTLSVLLSVSIAMIAMVASVSLKKSKRNTENQGIET
ncbi:hypothetical protein ABT56_13110 [Photobacterium aquae]|uniref:Uncharacterized protein n=1 Tax=Photobacterium aquae TaxID=1195763 RepID=A0A0J1H008_9GAMM|nr:hypothetical protein [Photobacterium aquae]KLV05124.1 hypothetical protein ABT56_13110 [Photobacterium aquae]